MDRAVHEWLHGPRLAAPLRPRAVKECEGAVEGRPPVGGDRERERVAHRLAMGGEVISVLPCLFCMDKFNTNEIYSDP